MEFRFGKASVYEVQLILFISLTSSINGKDVQIHAWTYLYISDSNYATLFLCNG